MRRTNKKKKSNLWRIVALTAVAVILGVCIYNWNAANLVGDRFPMPFGYGASVVLSGSMEPRLSKNDLVIVKAVEDYKVDDIVLYQDGDSLVIHRVIAVDGDTVITQGNTNNAPDPPITKSQIKGVLVGDIPGVGAIVNIIKHPISVCVILAAILLLTELSYRKRKNEDTNEIDEIKKEIEQLIHEIKDAQPEPNIQSEPEAETAVENNAE